MAQCKHIQFEGSSLADLRRWPKEARMAAGYQLDLVQHGRCPDDWKPMKTVGAGVREIRIAAADRSWRVIYVDVVRDRLYILHCFQKTAQKTRKADIDLARARYHAIRRAR